MGKKRMNAKPDNPKTIKVPHKLCQPNGERVRLWGLSEGMKGGSLHCTKFHSISPPRIPGILASIECVFLDFRLL
jgi:hypothetical protein